MTKLLANPYTQTVNKYTLHLHMNTLWECKKGFRAKSCKSSLYAAKWAARDGAINTRVSHLRNRRSSWVPQRSNNHHTAEKSAKAHGKRSRRHEPKRSHFIGSSFLQSACGGGSISALSGDYGKTPPVGHTRRAGCIPAEDKGANRCMCRFFIPLCAIAMPHLGHNYLNICIQRAELAALCIE